MLIYNIIIFYINWHLVKRHKFYYKVFYFLFQIKISSEMHVFGFNIIKDYSANGQRWNILPNDSRTRNRYCSWSIFNREVAVKDGGEKHASFVKKEVNHPERSSRKKYNSKQILRQKFNSVTVRFVCVVYF